MMRSFGCVFSGGGTDDQPSNTAMTSISPAAFAKRSSTVRCRNGSSRAGSTTETFAITVYIPDAHCAERRGYIYPSYAHRHVRPSGFVRGIPVLAPVRRPTRHLKTIDQPLKVAHAILPFVIKPELHTVMGAVTIA